MVVAGDAVRGSGIPRYWKGIQMAKMVKRPAAVRQVIANDKGKLQYTGMMVVPDPRLTYDDDDPIVRAYPWMFGSADETHQERKAEQERTSVPTRSKSTK